MADEVRLWLIGDDEQPLAVDDAPLDLESRLQEWLARDIGLLDPDLLVIGREVETDFGGYIDLLCIDAGGDLVIVELKRGRTAREVIAQALDYASWVVDLSGERVAAIADAYLGEGFERAFGLKFRSELPDTLNGGHRIVIVGSEIDQTSERIVRYLSDSHGVNINAATFRHFRLPGGDRVVARVFLIEPAEVDLRSRTIGSSKRGPNLSPEELRALAVDTGVGDLYDHAVRVFGRLLSRHTTRSSICFTGALGGSRKAVFSLLPGQSSTGDGLRYILYKHRFAELSGVREAELDGALPRHRDDWIYHPDSGPDYEGYTGFIVDQGEIDRLAAALPRT